MVGPNLARFSAIEVGVLGSHLGDFWTHHGRTVALVGVASVVVVVFLLSDEEIEGFFNGGHDGLVVDVAHVSDHGLSLSSLFFSERHDAGPVLGADVVALAVELGRVMDGEEDLEQGFVRDDGGVKLHLDHFGMSGCSAADRLIGRMGVVATRISGKGRLNAVNLFVGAFDAPKASSTNDHAFHGNASCSDHMKV